MDPQVEVVKLEVGKLELDEGDILLVRVDSRVLANAEAREWITKAVQKVLPGGTPWLLHDEYADFSVIKDPSGLAEDDPDFAEVPPADGGAGAEVEVEEVEHV